MKQIIKVEEHFPHKDTSGEYIFPDIDLLFRKDGATTIAFGQQLQSWLKTMLTYNTAITIKSNWE